MPNKREEITDVISEAGIKKLKVGEVLKFDYEGSPIYLKITRKDTKNMRIWAEHISLYDFNIGLSHYGHDVKPQDDGQMYCHDCEKIIDRPATEDGDVKAAERADRLEAEEREREENASA